MEKMPKTKIARTDEPAQSVRPRDFRKQARAQAQAIAASPHAAEDQDFIDAISVVDFTQEGSLMRKRTK